jgi:hypothetical protein
MQSENLPFLTVMLNFSCIFTCVTPNAVYKHMHITVKLFQYVQRDYSHVTLNPLPPNMGGWGGGLSDHEE